ncbi:hypothetical protein Tco_0152868 [Tanacetum coccineum]
MLAKRYVIFLEKAEWSYTENITPHGRIILEAVENVHNFWQTLRRMEVTNLRKYYNELSATECIFKLIVISRQQISFSKDYLQRSMHLLAIIESPRNFRKEFNFSCKELH